MPRVNLAYIHPRLLTTVILVDPVVQQWSAEIDPGKQGPPNPAQLSSFRRSLWPSREAAAASFQTSPFYRAWDPRVLEKWVAFGLRAVPTLLHPEAQPPQVTLTTTPAQEVFTFLRPNYEGYGVNGKPVNRSTHADLDPSRDLIYPFYRSEAPDIFKRLPELRPSALYLFGETSNVGLPYMNEAKLERTGIGIGGSGGAKDGKVKGITLKGVGHLIPMEAVDRTADAVSEWIGAEMVTYSKEQSEWDENWKIKSRKEKQEIDDTWRRMIGGPPKRSKM
jgi:hypothetical protein